MNRFTDAGISGDSGTGADGTRMDMKSAYSVGAISDDREEVDREQRDRIGGKDA